MITVDRKVGIWTLAGFVATCALAYGTIRSEVSTQAAQLKDVAAVAAAAHARLQAHDVAAARTDARAAAVEDKLNRLISAVDKIADKLDKPR